MKNSRILKLEIERSVFIMLRNKSLKFTAVTLVACMIVLMAVPTAHAVGGGTIEAGDMVESYLQNEARAYVEKYMDTMYLYQKNDFNKGTITEAISKLAPAERNKLLAETVSIDGVPYTLKEAQILLNQYGDFASYNAYCRSAQKIQRKDVAITIDILSTKIDGDHAHVRLYSLIKFRYPNKEVLSEAGDYQDVYFSKINGKWYITMAVSEEMGVLNLKEKGFDLKKSIQEFEELQVIRKENDQRAEAYLLNLPEEAEIENAQPYAESGNFVIPYNRNNAAAYAYTYSTTGYNDELSGNDSRFLNPNFMDCTNSGGNCQNYASQCVWAGFGGSDDPEKLSAVTMPMNEAGSGDDQWFSYFTDVDTGSIYPSDTFVNVWRFYHYWLHSQSKIASETEGNWIQKKVECVIPVGENFQQIGIHYRNLVGAVLHVIDDQHALVVSGATGYTYNDIEICANSPMRKALTYQELDYYHRASCKVLIPDKMISIGNPENRILKATAETLKPIAVGHSATLQGKTNLPCFRFAFGITGPDNHTHWRQVDTQYAQGVSINYTFTQRGLYTIVFSARHALDDTQTQTVADQHVYKVRIY